MGTLGLQIFLFLEHSILFHRQHRQHRQCSEWFRVTGAARQADPQLTVLRPHKSPHSATCRLAPMGWSLEGRLGHLERVGRGGAQDIRDQLLTRVSNLALSDEETGIVQTAHSVRCDRSLGALIGTHLLITFFATSHPVLLCCHLLFFGSFLRPDACSHKQDFEFPPSQLLI